MLKFKPRWMTQIKKKKKSGQHQKSLREPPAPVAATHGVAALALPRRVPGPLGEFLGRDLAVVVAVDGREDAVDGRFGEDVGREDRLQRLEELAAGHKAVVVPIKKPEREARRGVDARGPLQRRRVRVVQEQVRPLGVVARTSMASRNLSTSPSAHRPFL